MSMPSKANKKNIIGRFDSMKTHIRLTCGIDFTGRPKSVLLKQKLHRKKCDICSKLGGDPITANDLSSLSKADSVAFKSNQKANCQKLADQKIRDTTVVFPTVSIIEL